MDKDWEKIYDELDMVQRDIVPVVREFPDYLLQQGKQAYVVLDHGCGMGKNAFFLTEAMSRHGVDVTVDALDASQGALSIFQKVIEKSGLLKERPRAWINPRLHKASHLFPFDDGRFDGVLSVMALQHGLTSQIQEWSNDIARVLSDGGLLCLAVASTEDPRYATGEELEPGTRIHTKQLDGYIPHHFFSDKEIEGAFFPGFQVLYKKFQHRPASKADVEARDWEYILRKG